MTVHKAKAKLMAKGHLQQAKQEMPHPPSTPPQQVPANRLEAYSQSALAKETYLVATAEEGTRNPTLFSAAANLRRFIRHGALPEPVVTSALQQAAYSCGLGEPEVSKSIRSGYRKDDADGKALELPDTGDYEPTQQAYQIDAPAGDEPTQGQANAQSGDATPSGETPAEGEGKTWFDTKVDFEYWNQRAREEAKERLKRDKAQALGQQRPKPWGLRAFLEVPDEPAIYRIVDNLPVGGNVLLAAQQKAGKTSLIANLIRALVDHELFLDRFEVKPCESLVLLDNELDERMLRRWLRDQEIQNVDAVRVVSMKGRMSTFNILDDDTRAAWAQELSGAEVAIFDPLRPVLDALGMSEDKEAGQFLQAWDELKREAGISESIVVHHMGHNGDRARGDSRLVDWADVNWKIRKESQKQDDSDAMFTPLDDGGQRFYTAHGRDSYVPEGLLLWDPVDRRIRYAPKSDSPAPVDNKRSIMLDIVRTYGAGGVTFNKLWQQMNNEYAIPKQKAQDVIHIAQTDGTLTITPGPNNAQYMTENTPGGPGGPEWSNR